MKQVELDLTISEHGKWLKDEGGKRANLSGANLYGANLHNANLYGADLYGADLYGANLNDATPWKCDGEYHHITNVGSEKGTLELYSCGDNGWLIRRGCFIGSKVEFIAKVKDTHGGNEHAIKYLALIEILCGRLNNEEINTGI